MGKPKGIDVICHHVHSVMRKQKQKQKSLPLYLACFIEVIFLLHKQSWKYKEIRREIDTSHQITFRSHFPFDELSYHAYCNGFRD